MKDEKASIDKIKKENKEMKKILSLTKYHLIKTDYFINKLQSKKKQWNKQTKQEEKNLAYTHCINGLEEHINMAKYHLRDFNDGRTSFAEDEIKSNEAVFLKGDEL